jgi:WD40 repeat protein
LPSLKGHVIAVVGAAFCPDGKTLATGDMSGKVKLWNVATRQEMTTIALADRFPILSFSPDQNMLVASERPQTRGRIQALRVPSFEEIAAAESGHPQNPKGF